MSPSAGPTLTSWPEFEQAGLLGKFTYGAYLKTDPEVHVKSVLSGLAERCCSDSAGNFRLKKQMELQALAKYNVQKHKLTCRLLARKAAKRLSQLQRYGRSVTGRGSRRFVCILK